MKFSKPYFVDVEICELPDCLLDDNCVDVRKVAAPAIASLSARAFAALKLFRLFSRCPKGSAGIPALVSAAPPRRVAVASLDFPADADLFGDPLCDCLLAEPADEDRCFIFSAMAPVKEVEAFAQTLPKDSQHKKVSSLSLQLQIPKWNPSQNR